MKTKSIIFFFIIKQSGQVTATKKFEFEFYN